MNTWAHLISNRSTPSYSWNLGDLAAWRTPNPTRLRCHGPLPSLYTRSLTSVLPFYTHRQWKTTMNTWAHLISNRSTPSFSWNLGDLAAWRTTKIAKHSDLAYMHLGLKLSDWKERAGLVCSLLTHRSMIVMLESVSDLGTCIIRFGCFVKYKFYP